MSITAIYAGTFDPITYGHIDVVERASKLFQHIIIAIAASPAKKPLFSLEERLNLCEAAVRHLANVRVNGFSHLLADFAQEQGAQILIRGVRSMLDFDYETQLANINRQLLKGLETVFLLPSDQYRYISSSLVREVASLRGKVSQFVPEVVCVALEKKYQSI